MTKPYDPDAILADPFAHPIHQYIAEINIGIRDRGEAWSKCANCVGRWMVMTPADRAFLRRATIAAVSFVFAVAIASTVWQAVGA